MDKSHFILIEGYKLFVDKNGLLVVINLNRMNEIFREKLKHYQSKSHALNNLNGYICGSYNKFSFQYTGNNSCNIWFGDSGTGFGYSCDCELTRDDIEHPKIRYRTNVDKNLEKILLLESEVKDLRNRISMLEQKLQY